MKKSIILTMLISLLWLIPCHAQSIQISDGAAWLTGNQNADGSWGAQADLSFIYSAEAIGALKSSDAAPTNYSAGTNWLLSQDVATTDELSRKIFSLVNAGTDCNALLSTLLSHRNLDGGWSCRNSPASDPLDTALALQALKAANYSDTTVLYQAINYLTTNQNPDGGWAFVSGGPSNAYTAATVLRALAAFSSTFKVQSSIQKASTYLLTKQNPDGGFGSSPSNAYETALSIISLIESEQTTIQPLQNAVNYLTSVQLSNGSWIDDPYSTALALQALAKVKPNLSIASSDIAFSQSTPTQGDPVTISVTVRNTGLAQVDNVLVHIYHGDPGAGGSQIGSFTIPIIAAGGTGTVSLTYTMTVNTDRHAIYAKVDPSNAVEELDETDGTPSPPFRLTTRG